MSRIGRKPVAVPIGVEVAIQGALVRVRGPQGELGERLPEGLRAELKDGSVVISVEPGADPRTMAPRYGTARARVANLVRGTHQGFAKALEVHGLGFKASVQGETLVLNLGRSHPVSFPIPKGVKVSVDPKSVVITVAGASREAVGAAAAGIRALRPPEPYKGTGIRYRGEHIARKAGKTAAGAGAAAGGGKKA